jgi:hypothetical protein
VTQFYDLVRVIEARHNVKRPVRSPRRSAPRTPRALLMRPAPVRPVRPRNAPPSPQVVTRRHDDAPGSRGASAERF